MFDFDDGPEVPDQSLINDYKMCIAVRKYAFQQTAATDNDRETCIAHAYHRYDSRQWSPVTVAAGGAVVGAIVGAVGVLVGKK